MDLIIRLNKIIAWITSSHSNFLDNGEYPITPFHAFILPNFYAEFYKKKEKLNLAKKQSSIDENDSKSRKDSEDGD